MSQPPRRAAVTAGRRWCTPTAADCGRRRTAGCRRRTGAGSASRPVTASSNQARIRTCTRDPLLRLLYVVIALVLRNVWVWLHWERRATRRHGGRRLNLTRWTFRHLLLCLPHVAEFRLGVSDGVYVQEPA